MCAGIVSQSGPTENEADDFFQTSGFAIGKRRSYGVVKKSVKMRHGHPHLISLLHCYYRKTNKYVFQFRCFVLPPVFAAYPGAFK